MTTITPEDLRRHGLWLRGEPGGERLVLVFADLSGANLSGADLSGATLSGADLSGATLSGADFYATDLSGADLSGADLSGADLSGANLFYANLSGATLSGATLSRANLSGANLSNATLSGADLSRAILSGARWSAGTRWPSPTIVLLAGWGRLSNELTRDMMRYDASCHPDPAAFQRWANGGPCPYADDVRWQRAANFWERRECWDRRSRLKRPYDLAMRCLREKCEEVSP